MPGPVMLRLAPHQIPAMRSAIDTAISELNGDLRRLRFEGYVREPWLGDVVSAEMAAVYNSRVMDGPEGPFTSLLAYRAELLRVRDNLQLMEEHYRRTEGDVAELWGRA